MEASFSNDLLKVDTSFSINDSSQISQLGFSPHESIVSQEEFTVHRKRLNPENHIVGVNKMVCDSLTTANK